MLVDEPGLHGQVSNGQVLSFHEARHQTSEEEIWLSTHPLILPCKFYPLIEVIELTNGKIVNIWTFAISLRACVFQMKPDQISFFLIIFCHLGNDLRLSDGVSILMNLILICKMYSGASKR